VKRFVLFLFLAVAGCAAPSAEWSDDVPTIEPLGAIRAPQGLLIVRTFEMGARQTDMDPLYRGFLILDQDGHQVMKDRGFSSDWGAVRLFPGRYMVLSLVGDGICDRHWEKAQVIVAAGKITAVDFKRPGPREILD
jgi:hypothetical protein